LQIFCNIFFQTKLSEQRGRQAGIGFTGLFFRGVPENIVVIRERLFIDLNL